MVCMDCGWDSEKEARYPCPMHPLDEYLGYLMGEGATFRKAGQHSFPAEMLTIDEVSSKALDILKKHLAKCE
jgi:hypothetical protein